MRDLHNANAANANLQLLTPWLLRIRIKIYIETLSRAFDKDSRMQDIRKPLWSSAQHLGRQSSPG